MKIIKISYLRWSTKRKDILTISKPMVIFILEVVNRYDICNINMWRKNKLRIFIFFELILACSNWNLLVSLKLKMCSFVSIIKRSISLCSPLSALSEYRYHCISKTHDFTDFNMLDLNKKLEKDVKTMRFENCFPRFVCSEAATGGVLWKKRFLKISQNSQVFTWKFCETFKNTFFTEHLGRPLFFLLDSFFFNLGDISLFCIEWKQIHAG